MTRLHLILPVLLALACSAESASKTPPPPPAPPPAPAPTPAPRDAACGPEIEGQADNVRVAVLEALIRESLRKAEAAGVAHGEIVIGEERWLPNGQVFVGTTSGVAVFGLLGPSTPTGLRIVP